MSMMSAFVVALASLSSAGMIGLLLWKSLVRPATTYSYARCPACRQRLRFLARKAGRAGQCPRCLKRFPLVVHIPTRAAG